MAAVESPRDQSQSAFTPILRLLLDVSPAALAVVYVDADGECIDYCSRLPPFDAKIAAAQMMVTWSVVRDSTRRLGAGATNGLTIVGAEREVIVRRVSDDYALVVVVAAPEVPELLLAAIEATAGALRRESDAPIPTAHGVDVELRPAIGWPFAPLAFRRSPSEPRIEVELVLGRWLEGGTICFLVRTRVGAEVTLAYEPTLRRWSLRA